MKVDYEKYLTEARGIKPSSYVDKWLMRSISRKPTSWREIKKIDVDSAPSDVQDFIMHLEEYDAKIVFGKNNPQIYDDFLQADLPQWFLLKTRQGFFIINTEGYDYVRYAVKV
jgi:hypothetical protein